MGDTDGRDACALEKSEQTCDRPLGCPQQASGSKRQPTSAQPGTSEALVESVSGALASVLALLATYPIKTVYLHQALTSESGAAALSILDIVRRYKLSGLYVGIEPSILESAASASAYFYFYSRLRHWVACRGRRTSASVDSSRQLDSPRVSNGSCDDDSSTKDCSIGVGASLLVSVLAAVGNQLVTMPLTVCATRMQAVKKARMEGRTTMPASLGSVVASVYQESGVRGFWAGLAPSLVLVSNPAIQYMLYEQLLRLG